MEALRGRTAAVDPNVWHERVLAADRVVVDVGTGDGRSVLRMARAEPNWLVIGLDANAERMAESARRAMRTAAKGGAPNAVFVVCLVEHSPDLLHAIADEVWVQLPWAGLLRGVVRGDEPVLRGIRSLCRPDARIGITVGTDIWRPPVPAEIADLAVITPDDLRGPLAQRYRRAGLELLAIDERARDVTDPERAASLTSSWHRRLEASRAGASFLIIEARPLPPGAAALA